MMTIAVITLVALRLWVVLKKIWIKGKPVGVVRILSTSPRVKHSVITIKKPRTPFTATPAIMALGSVSEAFLISSHM